MEPSRYNNFDLVEIKFKNTRKEFLRNKNKLDIHPGEPVVLEAASGYDIGIVSMLGELVKRRMRIKKYPTDSKEILNIVRKPNQAEIEKWQNTMKLEGPTMLKARHIATELKLNMKISDVEYQADGCKATFYYTADERVDFRELIRHLADQFKVRVEMRQIGSRQEAGRLGGIGSCGRELCCSTWLTDFRSVSTNAARYQQLSINPQKLAGQCGKLKCCLNFELDSYLDAIKGFPSSDIKLRTGKGKAYCFKTDIFKGLMWYSYLGESNKMVILSIDRVHEIIAMNKNEELPDELEDFASYTEEVEAEPEFGNVVGQDSLTRFDTKNKGRKGKSKRKKKPQNRAQDGDNNRPKSDGKNTNSPKKRSGNKRPKNKQNGNKKPVEKEGQKAPNQNRKPGNKNPKNEGDRKSRPNRNNRNKNNQSRKKPDQNPTSSSDSKE
jgi:cell fate regulator YaaT (PSP1 superfamily)